MSDQQCDLQPDRSIRSTDVLYFLAEMAVYLAVAWWGFTRSASAAIRGLLGVGSIVVLAIAWAVFAAPRARLRLRGMADLLFRVAWFGLGAAAGLLLILRS